MKGKKGQKEAYKTFMQSLLRSNDTQDASRRVRIAESFDYYYGRHMSKKYGDLLTLHEGDSTFGKTPFARLNYDSISPKVNLMIGELDNRGFEVGLRARNREAVERKRAYERKLRYLSMMQPFFERTSQFTGEDIGMNERVPRNEEGIQEEMSNYRDIFEQLMEAGVERMVDESLYQHRRKNLALDLFISNEVHGKVELKDGKFRIRRINPFNCIPDYYTEDDFFVDQQRFIEVRYIPITEACRIYDIPENEMKELIEGYRQGRGGGAYSGTAGNTHHLQPFVRRYGSWEGTNFDRVLVFEAQWIDLEDRSMKLTYDNANNPHLHKYVDNPKGAKLKGRKEKQKGDTHTKKVEVVKYGTLLGGELLIDWGKKKSYVRDQKNPSKTCLDYVSLVHNYNGQESVSLVQRIGAIQDFKNYILTVLQKKITNDIGMAIAIDTSKLDEKIYGVGAVGIKNALLGLKGYGVYAYNGKKTGFMQGDAKAFEKLDVKTQMFVMEYINLAQFLDSEMNKVVGINEARTGQVGERALKSTTQAARSSSSLMTQTYFSSFMGWEKLIFDRVVKKMAVHWDENPEEYETIALQYDVVLPPDFSMQFQDFDVTVEVAPLSRQELLEAANFALQANAIGIADYLEITDMAVNNRKRAYRKFIEVTRKREAMMMHQQQQQQQMQQQAMFQQAQMTNQGKMAVENTRGQWAVRKQEVASGAVERADRLKVQEQSRRNQNDYEIAQANAQEQVQQGA